MDPYEVKSMLGILLQYNSLLKKDRPPEAEVEIKKSLQKEKNIIRLINQIKEIDEKYEAQEKKGVETAPAGYGATHLREERVFKTRPAIRKTPFLNFLFSGRKEMVRLCQKNFIFVPKLMGFKFYLSNEASVLLQEIRKRALKTALPLTGNVLEDAWKVLEPAHYNYFYFLNNFLNNYTVRFSPEKNDIRQNYDFVQGFVRDYLVLLNHKNLLEEIKGEGVSDF
jgi:hypothetical protein